MPPASARCALCCHRQGWRGGVGREPNGEWTASTPPPRVRVRVRVVPSSIEQSATPPAKPLRRTPVSLQRDPGLFSVLLLRLQPSARPLGPRIQQLSATPEANTAKTQAQEAPGAPLLATEHHSAHPRGHGFAPRDSRQTLGDSEDHQREEDHPLRPLQHNSRPPAALAAKPPRRPHDGQWLQQQHRLQQKPPRRGTHCLCRQHHKLWLGASHPLARPELLPRRQDVFAEF
mmetsp:Transcript_29864/g.75159  ORF Transcript_29864/g.75159 Transcript_29864/m.75159 type:complete len:231 (-) Transcript_29864:120-812(-)